VEVVFKVMSTIASHSPLIIEYPYSAAARVGAPIPNTTVRPLPLLGRPYVLRVATAVPKTAVPTAGRFMIFSRQGESERFRCVGIRLL